MCGAFFVSDKSALVLSVSGLVAVLVILLTLMFYGAVQEAATFNKFAKPGTPRATMWDAVFADLRVDTE